MRFVMERDAHAFAARVRPLLDADPANNVMATVLLAVLEARQPQPPPVFAYAVDESGAARTAALRVPPRPMLCTAVDAPGAESLLDVWLAVDPEPGQINALAETARLIAAAWSRRTGRGARLRMRLALHLLRAVTAPPQPAAGRLIPAAPAHRELLIRWWRAFAVEAGVFGMGAEAPAAVAHRLARGSLWRWADPAGAPVSLVGLNPNVAGVVRVGPVYTPPEHRCRGYASAAVAEASRRALGSGAEACILFTDLANPTSNKIYAEVGYRRFADWEEYELAGPPG